MLKKAKLYTRHLITGANIAAIAAMLLAGYSDRIDPETSSLLSNTGLFFPVTVAANFLFIIIWLLVSARHVAIPVLGFIVCYFPIRTYIPLNISKDIPDNAIKVLSYNVMGFSTLGSDDNEMTAMEYIKNCNADIACLQEAYISSTVRDGFSEIYEHIDTVRIEGSSSIAVLSRYPIVKKERIHYPSKGNLSAAFYLKKGDDTILVINNYFEISGLSVEDRDKFRKIVHGETEKDTLKSDSRRFINILAESAKKRSVQVKAVAEYIRKHKNMDIILCGDFNDNPISYTHYIISRELDDCYVESGNGPGWTYNQNSMKVRIDHIFCSDDFVPYGCYIDDKMKASDHYPVSCWLKKRDNQ